MSHRSVRRYGDQYHCAECGRQWDVGDMEPPPCKRESRAGREAVDSMRKMFCKKTFTQ